MNRATALLVIAVAVALTACGRNEPKPDAASASPAAPVIGAEEKAFLALLPAAGIASDWTRAREPRRYSQADLWEYIDGAAETYLAFGFQELATAGYTRAAEGVEATADLFKMAEPVGAFGIFSQERAASCEKVPVGVEGCSAGGVLTFWSGPFFVKLTAFKDTPGTRAALLALATAIAASLGSPGAVPPQVGWFPEKNLVPRSVRYVPKDALGQSFLTNAFEAQYQDGAARNRLVLIPFDSIDGAAAALARYRAFLATGGRTIRDVPRFGDAAFSGTDSYYGNVMAARSGAFVAISLGAPSGKAGQALIEASFARRKGTR